MAAQLNLKKNTLNNLLLFLLKPLGNVNKNLFCHGFVLEIINLITITEINNKL